MRRLLLAATLVIVGALAVPLHHRDALATTAHYKVLDFNVLDYANAHGIDTTDPQWYGLAMSGIMEEQLASGWRFLDAQNFNGAYGQRMAFHAVGAGNCP